MYLVDSLLRFLPPSCDKANRTYCAACGAFEPGRIPAVKFDGGCQLPPFCFTIAQLIINQSMPTSNRPAFKDPCLFTQMEPETVPLYFGGEKNKGRLPHILRRDTTVRHLDGRHSWPDQVQSVGQWGACPLPPVPNNKQGSGCFRQYAQERRSRERMSSFIAQKLDIFLYRPMFC
jgi:hypothetical protein